MTSPRTPPVPPRTTDPAYSPTGEFLLVDAGEQIAILKGDGDDFRLLPQQTTNDGAPAGAPDGKRFVFTGIAEGGDRARPLRLQPRAKAPRAG